MHEYSRSLIMHALEGNDWVPGDLLKKFTFPDTPPVGGNYPEFFRQWMHEADAIERQTERTKTFQEIYAFAYVYAITQLGVVSEPATNQSWIEWITETLQAPYPDGNNRYDQLERGLQRVFKFTVSSSAHGRMFISGIGRQSGYFVPDYAREYLRWAESEAFRDEDWEHLQEKINIAESKVPRNGAYKDYQPIWDVWTALDELRRHNALNLEHLDEIADALDVVSSIAERVLPIFDESDAGKKVWIQPELHLTSNDDLVIRFPKRGVFPRVSARSDVVIRLLDTTFRYRPDVNEWVLYGQPSAECNVPERVAPLISLLYKDGENFIEVDLTPEVFEGAVCLFNANGSPVRGNGRLVAEDTYRVWKTVNWNDDLSFNIDDDCLISPQEFRCPKTSELLLCDNHGTIHQAYAVRDPSSLQIELGQDSRLASFVPGKRTYFKLPVIEIKSVVGVERITLRCLETNWEASADSNSFQGAKLDLSQLFPSCTVYGRFKLTVALDTRVGHRRFSVLPADLESNLDERIPVGEQGQIRFFSAELEGGEHVVSVTSEQIDFDTVLAFNNDWVVPVKATIARRGAFVRISSRNLDLAKGCPPINVDDLYDSGEVVVYGQTGEGVSLGFHKNGDEHEMRCIVGQFPKAGMLSFSLNNAKDALVGDFDYKYLTECTRMSVRLATADGGFAPENLGGAPLVQYAAKKPKIEWQESTLILRHKISADAFACSPYLALLPVTAQATDRIPVLSMPKAELPDWANRYSAELRWEVDQADPESKKAIISNLSDGLPDSGYILFVMCKDVRYGDDRRLSAGIYIAPPFPQEHEYNEIEKAFFEVHEHPERLAHLFEGNRIDADFINKLIINAGRLNATEFLLSISSFDWNKASGFLFRNFRYWLPLMLHTEIGAFQQNDVLNAQINLFDRFWNLELFAYDDFLTARNEGLLPRLEQTSFDLIHVATHQMPINSCWVINSLTSQKYIMQCRNILQSMMQNGRHPVSEETGCLLHEWRKNPILGEPANRLRRRLKKVKFGGETERCWYSHIIIHSILAFLDDQECVAHFIQEINQ